MQCTATVLVADSRLPAQRLRVFLEPMALTGHRQLGASATTGSHSTGLSPRMRYFGLKSLGSQGLGRYNAGMHLCLYTYMYLFVCLLILFV